MNNSVARPTGITILAILALIGGIFSVLAGLAAIGLGGIAGGTIGGSTGAAVGFVVILAGLVALIGGALYLAFAYGAWTLKPWGWLLGIVGAGFGVVSAVLNFFGNDTGFVSLIIGVAISGGILYYLFQPHVKSAFGRS